MDNKRIIIIVINILYVFAIRLNFLFIKKFINFDIIIYFHEIDYILIK